LTEITTMTTKTQHHNRQIVERYTDQPSRLPADLRALIEQQWRGEPVQLYALADLDAAMRLAHTWVALGPTHIAIAARTESGQWDVHNLPRDRVRAVREAQGLSGSVLTLLRGAGEPPLAVLRYTQRQRRAMENLRFVLEEQLVGRAIDSRDPDEEYAESVASPIREAQALVAGNRMAVLWRLLGYLEPYRGRVVAGLSAATVITLVSLVPPYLAGYLIDTVIRPVQEGALSAATGTTIAWIAVASMAVVFLVRQASAVVRLRMMSVLGELVARDLRTELYEHLQTLSLSFYSRKKTGSIITRVSSDTDRLWEFLAFGVVDVSLSAVMLLGLGAVLISLDWRLGLVMTLPVPVFCWMIFRHGERINQLFIRTWRKWSRVTDVLSDTIPGMRVVKAFNQEGREKRRFKQRNDDVTLEANRIHHLWTSFWPGLMLAVHATTVAVWVFAIPRLLGNAAGAEPSLSAGTFVSFLLYTTMFIAPIEVIGQMARTMNRATSSAHRVFEILDTQPEIVDVAEPLRERDVRLRRSAAGVAWCELRRTAG
jgi:ATP-binding cassette subfamily B protein